MPAIINQSSNTNAVSYSDKKQRIYDFLSGNPVAVLSTVTPDGDPHGAVIYFSIDKQFVVSFLTKSGTRKYDNLKHNDHAMITVFEPHTQTTVQLTCKATEITDPYKINLVAQKNMNASVKTSDGGIPAIIKLDAGDCVAFWLKPVQVRMAVYARPDSGDYTELFETLEPFELDNA
jgi:general stress protein 26